MPRRPRKQPRASNGAGGGGKAHGPTDRTAGKLKKWVRREDVEGDEEDQFHHARDRILLEGEDAEGGEDWGDGEEEVFGLDLDDDSDGSDPEAKRNDDPASLSLDEELSPRKRRTTKKPAQKPSSSSSESGSDEFESWGRSKSAYYASNAHLLAGKEGEEDEDEANEMEEHEARRLQARLREVMRDEDYGLDDRLDLNAADAVLDDDEPAVASNDTILRISGVPLDKAAALRLLEKTSPETLALTREWDDVAQDLVRVQERLDRLESTTPDALALGLSHLHHQTLLTYVTILAFYLHLRAAAPVTLPQAQIQPPRVKLVLTRLLTLKQALATMEDLDFEASDDEDDSDASDLAEEGLAELGMLMNSGKRSLKWDMDEVWGRGKEKLGLGELEALLKEADAAEEGARPRKRVRKDASNNEEPAFNGVKPIRKTKRTKTKKRAAAPPKPAFDLMEPSFVPMARGGARPTDDGTESYGEVTALSMTDDADKKARKRSLRFHTSKIEGSARRREEGREKMGDDDIPYRERKKAAEARVRREVEKTRGEGGDDLDVDGDGDVDIVTTGSEKRKRDTDDASDEQGDDGYYELVKRAKKERKEEKMQEYEDARMAERFDSVENGPGGPRSLTRAILKNKGLTPRRAKSVRNPRVKKRERFEKAKKKVRSQKAVYKGSLAGKPYGGEESGITKVVKSVKL